MSRKFFILLSIILGLAVTTACLVFLQPRTAATAAPAAPFAEPIDSGAIIEAAMDYIQTQQRPDGGIAGFGALSDPDSSARAVLALAAAGRPIAWMSTVTGTTLLDYLSTQAVTYTHDASGTLFPGRAGLLLAAVAAAGADPTSFGGIDILAELDASYHPATGAYSTTASQGFSSGEASDFNQAWAILGLSSAAQPIPSPATDYLSRTQGADGSWGFGDPDTTALAVVAIIGSGNRPVTDPMIQDALDYFRDTQLDNGGWKPGWDSDPLNADSTGWIVQALSVAGYLPPTESWATNLGNPLTALASLQKPDGSIGGTYANAYSTIEAIYGLTGTPLYNLGALARAQRAMAWMNTLQNEDGSWSTPFGQAAGATADVALAFAAAGIDPHTVHASGSMTSAMDYLAAHVEEYILTGPLAGADTAGKLALTVEAAGEDAHNFGGINIIHVLTDTHYSPTLGAFGIITNTWHQAFALLGLTAAGESTPISATQNLLDLQQADGGWKYDLGPWSSASAADSTGLAMQALIAAGILPTHTSLISATDFLNSIQDEMGGWQEANSTAMAIQGLLALGLDLGADPWLKNSHSPYEALAVYQKSDGPFVYDFDNPWVTPNDDLYATRQAVPALLKVYFPFTPSSLNPYQAAPKLTADPDRTVLDSLQPSWGNSVLITIPYGSDLNRNTSLALDWRQSGMSEWMIGTVVYRADGFFTATLPLTLPLVYEFRATFSDSEGVQAGEIISPSLSIEAGLAPVKAYLPIINK